MAEKFKYEDKRVGKDENDKGSLKNLVNEEFKKIDKFGYRDDQEIRNAGWNICNKLIEEIKKDRTKIFGSRALEPLTKLIVDLKKEYNKMNGMKLMTNNSDKINQLANRIDNAENETLRRLSKNRTTQDSRNLVSKGNEAYKDKPMFTMEGGNDIKKQTGNIIFTEASNPVRIDQALKGLFNNPNIVYEIDYSGCNTSTPKGKAIKDKMTSLIGAKTCYLRYDKDQNTYTIRDKDGNGISNRAYIWEGVKLIPAGVRQRNAYVEQKKQDETLGNLDNSQLDNVTKAMLKDMPSAAKKLNPDQQKDLAKKTENRIAELLRKAKKLGYELETECVSRKHFGNGHMELHLISGSSEADRTIWGNDGDYNKILGEELDDFIGDNEGEYKTYLTNRIKAKWQELDSLTKTETTNLNKKGKQNLTEKEKEQAVLHKQQMLYGIGLLEKMVNNYRETEGDSWDNDDRDLVQIKNLIRNAKASINNSDILDDDAINRIFIEPIWSKWSSVKRIQKTIDNGQGQVINNPTYDYQKNLLKNVFLGNKEEQIIAIRKLGGYGRLLDKTETSFLAEEIEGNEDIQTKDAEINKCLENIKNRTTMSVINEDGSVNTKVKGWYDNTYASAKKGTDSLITLFVGRGWLPNNRRKEEKEVRKSMDNLRNQLISIDSQTNNINVSIDDTIKKQHQQRLMLEQKGNKTEDEIKLLQSLIYLEENPEKAKEIYKKAIEINNIEQKYGALGQIVRGGLLSALGELGGGVTGKNADIADIYKDIKGYGWFDLSDENAKIAGDLAGDILEEVIVLAVAAAVGVATAGIGSTAIIRAETAAISAKRGAKGIKVTKYIAKLTNKLTKPIGKVIKKTGNYVKTSKPGKYIAKTAERAQNTRLGKNLNKIRLEQNNARIAESQANRAKMLELWKKENKTLGEMYKLGTLANKEGSMGIKAVAAIFEGTGFHISSTVIHNAINGAELNTGLNPFGYTEGPNGEKISNFKGYVQSIAFLKILKTIGQPIQNLTQASLTSALGEKISANTFGKILQSIGSITGEFGTLTVTDEAINVIFEGELKELTVQDAVHTIGIILGLRAYGKIKQITSLKIKEYNKNKKELKVEINGKDIVVNEDMLDKPIEKNKESNKSKEEEIKAKEEEIKAKEEEINNLKKKISGIENRLKEINEQISEIETNREISNNKIVANHISERRTKSNNGNNPSENIKINEHYDGKIIDGEIKIIDKRTGKETKIKFDAKKKINKLLGNDKELEKLDFEIAQRMILGIKYGHIEVEGIEEAMKIIEGYPKMNLEIVGLENGNYGVRRKTNIRELRQQKAELDEQLKGLKSNQRKKTIELNKMKKEQDSNNVEQEPKDDNVEQEAKDDNVEQEAKDDNVEQEVKKDNGEQESRRQDIGKETEGEKGGREELNEVDNIEKNLEQLVTETRTENLDNIKLDWITKAMFEGGIYFEGLSRFFKKSKTLPKKFIKKVRDNLLEMKNKCRSSLSEAKKKLVEKRNNFFENKLAEEGEEIEIKEEEIEQIEKDLPRRPKLNPNRKDQYNKEWLNHMASEGEVIDLYFREGKGPVEGEKWLKEKDGYRKVEDGKTTDEVLTEDEMIVKMRNVRSAYKSETVVTPKRPKLNPNRKDQYNKEWLNHMASEGEVIDLYFREGKGPVEGEKWLKEKDGYRKVENGKTTDEVLTEDEMIVKMRNVRSVYKSETQISNERNNKTEEITDNDTPENIADKLENSMENNTNFEVSQNAFVSGRFIEGIKNWFNKIIQKPNISLPRNSIIRLKNKISEMMKNRGNKLNDVYKKFVERFERYLNNLLNQREERIEIKKQQKEQKGQENQRREREEELTDADIQILYMGIQQPELNMIRNLNKGKNEQIYLKEFGEPKNIITLGNGEDIYVSNCLIQGSRKYIVGYVKKGNELKVRLFYRSNSEGIWRACPGERPDGAFSKGEDIPNFSYETTTRVPNELQYKFDSLELESTNSNPITIEGVGYNALLPEMISEVEINKLFNGPENSTARYMMGNNSKDVKNMYRNLGKGINLNEMKIIKGKGYTYKHEYLGTIEVQVGTLKRNGKDINIYFAHEKNDPQNRVRVEEVRYTDAQINSFGIYDKQINASPLTGKPIDYTQQVPTDMQGNQKIGTNYIDIRDLYQENPIIMKYKELYQQYRAAA